MVRGEGNAGRSFRGGARGAKPVPAMPVSAGPLATLVYRSRAVQPFSDAELIDLTQAAQKRNRSESITGLVLYDDSRFFQWLEGPQDSLSRIMHSINNDGRHDSIEVIARQQTRQRTFAGWDMKLALPGAAAAPWTREVITPSRDTVDALRRRPEIAPSVLEGLAPGLGRMQAILGEVIRTHVIPQFAMRHGAGNRANCEAAGPAAVHPDAARLAAALLGGDAGAALAMLPGPRHVHLAESVARHLGDLWMDDACSELEVTSALCALQTALLRLERASPDPVWTRAPAGTALVAPHPGEPHGLAAALSAHAFRRAGWAVRTAFPARDGELRAMLADGWFDTLDLSLSLAFRREHMLPALAETVALARKASRNPALKVVVGGRIFREDAGQAALVGADPAGGAPSRRDAVALAGP